MIKRGNREQMENKKNKRREGLTLAVRLSCTCHAIAWICPLFYSVCHHGCVYPIAVVPPRPGAWALTVSEVFVSVCKVGAASLETQCMSLSYRNESLQRLCANVKALQSEDRSHVPPASAPCSCRAWQKF